MKRFIFVIVFTLFISGCAAPAGAENLSESKNIDVGVLCLDNTKWYVFSGPHYEEFVVKQAKTSEGYGIYCE